MPNALSASSISLKSVREYWLDGLDTLYSPLLHALCYRCGQLLWGPVGGGHKLAVPRNDGEICTQFLFGVPPTDLKPPLQLPPCPQNIFHPVPTPQTPFSTAPVPSKHISPGANTSNPLFNCPHALKTHFTQCQHIQPPFQLPPCPQNTFQPVPTPQTPFATAPMPSKHISPSANTSNPLFNCSHTLKTHFT